MITLVFPMRVPVCPTLLLVTPLLAWRATPFQRHSACMTSMFPTYTVTDELVDGLFKMIWRGVRTRVDEVVAGS